MLINSMVQYGTVRYVDTNANQRKSGSLALSQRGVDVLDGKRLFTPLSSHQRHVGNKRQPKLCRP
jgi:hypothetical protein